MNAQLMRCKKRTDTQDIELSMDLMVILQNNKDEERNADRAILDRLASKLELQMLPDLRAETVAIKKLINERNGQHADSTKQIIELLHKFKAIAGIDEKNVLGGEVFVTKSLDKCPSLMIPDDFLCPITLEIMTDPVIVASGQARALSNLDSSCFNRTTYERGSKRNYCFLQIFGLEKSSLEMCRRTRGEASRSGWTAGRGHARRRGSHWRTFRWRQTTRSRT